MHYTFRYSTFVKVITFIGLWALALILYLLLTVDGLSSFAFVLWAGALGLIYPPLAMPRSIKDDGETVVLKRLLWSKRYSRTTYDISEVSGINLMNGLRVFGSGAYFGYSGYFYKTKIGLFKLLATEDTGHYLRIQRKGSKCPLYIAYQPTQSNPTLT